MLMWVSSWIIVCESWIYGVSGRILDCELLYSWIYGVSSWILACGSWIYGVSGRIPLDHSL